MPGAAAGAVDETATEVHAPAMALAGEIARVIAAFERRLGARLCIYDYDGAFRAYLPPDRTHHDHPLCRHVNRQGAPCSAFDRVEIERRLRADPEPFFKRCHAQIVEHVAPLRHGGRMVGAVLSGQFTLRALPEGLVESPTRLRLGAESRRQLNALPQLTPAEMEDLDLLMRAFAARLECLLDAALSQPAGPPRRRWTVENFLGRRGLLRSPLRDLARELGLSPERARHAVKELFGVGYAELLMRRRVDEAKRLLLHTDLTIAAIAERCGFSDASHLHRAFRRHERATPASLRGRAAPKP
jgi:AraC-like DNA-binding protein